MTATQTARLKKLRTIPSDSLSTKEFWEREHLIMLEIQSQLIKYKGGT